MLFITSNDGPCLTRNCGMTSPLFMSSTNDTFLPCCGGLPKFRPTWDHCFHLLGGFKLFSALSKTYIGYPKGLECFAFLSLSQQIFAQRL